MFWESRIGVEEMAENFGSFPTEVGGGGICNSCFLSKVLYSCETASHAFLGRFSFHSSSVQWQRTARRRYVYVATAVP